MRAAVYQSNGPAREVLRLVELPDPQPGPGEVLVRVHASGVNPSDVKRRARPPLEFPRIVPHSDGAGVIEQVGEGVSKSRIGERVWLWNGQWNRAFGTAAERIALPQVQAVRLPDWLSFAEGSSFGIPLQTAAAALLPFEGLASTWVLVQGGAGAVGHFAIQVAKGFGARVIATAGSPEKAEAALAAGADQTVDHRGDIAAQVEAITKGNGVDRIVEVEFGRNAAADLALIRPHGTIAVYGSALQPQAQITVRELMFKNATLRFVLVYELLPRDRAAVLAAIERLGPNLKVRLAEAFPLEQIAQAHEAQERGAGGGNITVTI